MIIFAYFILFILGVSVGSFLNALIYRLEKGEGIVLKKSHCVNCNKNIAWHDLAPIISFFILRGKCRNCSSKISFQYPLIEFSVGILFVAVYFLAESRITNQELWSQCNVFNFYNVSCFMFHVSWIYLLIVFSGLFAILAYDFKHYIIPNKILYPLIVFVLFFGFLSFLNWDLFRNLKLEIVNFESWQGIALSLLVPLFFLSLIILSRGKWMGMGDVKLAFFMALFLGWPNVLIAVFGAFWLGTLVSLPLLALGKKGLKSQIPFGPFLIIGTFIAFFWGEKMIDWYLHIAF